MPNTVRVKRSSVQGKVPLTTDLQLGELAINTYDGRLYTLRSDGTTNTVSQLSPSLNLSPVRCATTASITLSGTQTVDGVSLIAGDRVLVKNQATASANGIYLVSASSWTRATDADIASEVAAAVVSVQSGTTNGGTLYYTSFKSTDVLNTTSMSWFRVITSGDSGTVTSTMIAANTIVDSNVSATAAIAGTKITPDFGAQLIQSSQANQAILLSGSLNPATTAQGLFSAGTLGFSGARMGASFSSAQTSYYQVVLQNTSNNVGASCDFVVCNDVSTDTTFYGNLGINSSTFTGSGALNAPNATYVTSTSGPMVIGTTTAHDIRFAYNSETTDSLTISSATATFGKTLKPVTGTATVAPFQFTSGTNLTSAAAGAMEYDGAAAYFTPDTTIGRGYIPSTQTFRLTTAGTAIGNTIANFFGTNSNIPLVANAFYEIDIYMLALRGTSAGTAVITLTNSAAPTLMIVDYEESPITGVVAPPGTATMLRGQASTTLAAYTVTTGSLTASVNHYFHLKLFLNNGTGTSLKIQMTAGTGQNTMTPQAGSVWFCRRLPGANTGTFAA